MTPSFPLVRHLPFFLYLPPNYHHILHLTPPPHVDLTVRDLSQSQQAVMFDHNLTNQQIHQPISREHQKTKYITCLSK